MLKKVKSATEAQSHREKGRSEVISNAHQTWPLLDFICLFGLRVSWLTSF
jgi:hypothetical protein